MTRGQLPVFVKFYWSTDMHICLCLCFVLQRQSWILSVDRDWSIKMKIFTIWPFKKELGDSPILSQLNL